MKQNNMCIYLVVTMLIPRLMMAAGGPESVGMGTAANFTILAASAITSSGGTINGDVGLSPAPGSNIGVTDLQVNGTIYAVDGSGPVGTVVAPELLTAAVNDVTTAYNDAAGRPVTATVGTELGGTTLSPGVYDSASGTFGITGTLTLDAAGDHNAVFIFKMGTTLITATECRVVLTNGAQVSNVFWQVGSSATLGSSSVFRGTILANVSITMNAGSVFEGRALARTGAVTFSSLSGGLPILSISVTPATWSVGTIAMGANRMSTAINKISVTNNGNVAETFTLKISDEDDRNEWTHSPVKTGAGNEIYVLSGLFCAEADIPVESSFNQTTSEDVLSTTDKDATAADLAYAGGTATAVAVPAEAVRSLWLRLDAPTLGIGGIEHKITIRVGCFQP